MGCHQKALDRIDNSIKRFLENITTDPTTNWKEYVDMALEQRYDCLHRATEWDADHWGFKPDTWMIQERIIMEQRISEEIGSNGG